MSLPFNKWHQRTQEDSFGYPDQQTYERLMEFFKTTQHMFLVWSVFASLLIKPITRGSHDGQQATINVE
jgi:hypothetical protein